MRRMENALGEIYKSPEQESFQEKLLSFLKEQDPEAFERTVEEQEKLRQNLEARERALDDKELEDALREYGINPDLLERTPEGRFKIQVTNHFSKDRLPAGYGYKGGAARALLLRALNIDPSYFPRDVDIIRFFSDRDENFIANDQELAEKFMPDDLDTGFGVEYVPDIDGYFSERDFSINEVVVDDDKIIASRQCVLDSVRRIIRLTDFEKSRFSDGSINSKMLSKIFRFYTESIQRYGEAEVAEDYLPEGYFINPFWLAVQFDRVFSISPILAENYFKELKNLGQIPESIKSPEEAVVYLKEIMFDPEDHFYYRYAPTKQFDLEETWLEEKFRKAPKARGHKKSRGEK